MCDEAGTKAAHRFSGWKTVYGATKDSAGLKRHTCSVCGYDQEEKRPATSGGSSGGSSSSKPSTTTEILPSIGCVPKKKGSSLFCGIGKTEDAGKKINSIPGASAPGIHYRIKSGVHGYTPHCSAG